jgi:hypothetical protein
MLWLRMGCLANDDEEEEDDTDDSDDDVNSVDVNVRIVQIVLVHVFCCVEPPSGRCQSCRGAVVPAELGELFAKGSHRVVYQWYARLITHGHSFNDICFPNKCHLDKPHTINF